MIVLAPIALLIGGLFLFSMKSRTPPVYWDRLRKKISIVMIICGVLSIIQYYWPSKP